MPGADPPSPLTSRSTLSHDLRTALKEAMARLREAEVPSATLAAELLLMHELGCERAWLYAHPEEILAEAAVENYFRLVTQRAAGVPTQYLTGKQEFWGLEFAVTPDVLIPRPETEHLLEVALERLGPAQAAKKPGGEHPLTALRIADVGTGSGCIAVALARELPHAEIVAIDISPTALEVARRNAARHGVAERIEFLQGDLLAPAANRVEYFHLIVSNPPYVARYDAGSLPREVREHEPAAALYGGERGSEIYPRLIEQAGDLLRRGGVLVLELGYNAAPEVCRAVQCSGRWTNLSVTNDLAGIPRVLAAERL
ncbi:MAG: peptide chain release factor N(5)-glutamine methyltransferase [Acidobacteria bacterium]|nr:peptide chain release factor N(5)-glutamine methyltransferase [Acidobacteriota bacterium]